MMVSYSTQLSGNPSSTSEGKVTQARTVHGFSQRHSSEHNQQAGSKLTSVETAPSFRLTAAALSASDVKTTQETAKTEKNDIDTDEHSSSESMAALTSALGVQEEPSLAAQAQDLLKGMLPLMGKQAEQPGKTPSSTVSSEARPIRQEQNSVLLNTSSKQQEVQQGLAAASPSSRLSISSADFQALLSQPTQNQPMASPLQVQAPSAHAPTPASATSHIQTQGSEWAAVRVDTSAGKWGEQMMQVLHDRVTLQAQQNVQEAKIRLDPPDLGKLDLHVRMEGDRLSVQINANTAATREALMQVSERLRTELQEQNFIHVDVNVGSDQGQERHQPHTNEEDTTIFAARESSAFSSNKTTNYSEHWLSTQA
ncbi:flagellar hook-length control protein FliK [Vibrio sp. ES.051]|uniref:flagellar hook-length control protein FliK n=1 Tax=Vibrio sp. ES.051 TaxID=1761909 RepID=UPI000BF55648|nr:flagellar hook-length control protein FliK [Vibrio sp. ES.051]PFG58488.1 flagellar hook-length control protein FliK [Vibrio sp. ES.051]